MCSKLWKIFGILLGVIAIICIGVCILGEADTGLQSVIRPLLVVQQPFQQLPSGLKPAAIAIASSMVDFPLPFLPTKKVMELAVHINITRNREGKPSRLD